MEGRPGPEATRIPMQTFSGRLSPGHSNTAPKRGIRHGERVEIAEIVKIIRNRWNRKRIDEIARNRQNRKKWSKNRQNRWKSPKSCTDRRIKQVSIKEHQKLTAGPTLSKTTRGQQIAVSSPQLSKLAWVQHFLLAWFLALYFCMSSFTYIHTG